MSVSDVEDGDVNSNGEFCMVQQVGGGTLTSNSTVGSFRDFQSGEIIPAGRIIEIIDKIELASQKFHIGRKIFKEVIQSTNDRSRAMRASNEAAGGTMTHIYNVMCQDKVLICLNVKLPPAKNEQEMYQNQDKLKVLISRLDSHLADNIIDIFTSRYEPGSVSETTAYVRLLYFLGEQVEALAELLSQVQVGTHKLKAMVCFEGRKKLYGKEQNLAQWEATIYGHRLPDLPMEELKKIKENCS